MTMWSNKPPVALAVALSRFTSLRGWKGRYIRFIDHDRLIHAMRFVAILSVGVIGVFCQGCVVFHYPTPEVRGSVVDAASQKPIANVRVQDWKHTHIFCKTAADGTFDLPAGHYWGPCFLIPG